MSHLLIWTNGQRSSETWGRSLTWKTEIKTNRGEKKRHSEEIQHRLKQQWQTIARALLEDTITVKQE